MKQVLLIPISGYPFGTTIKIEIDIPTGDYATADAESIIRTCLPLWLSSFLTENSEYKNQTRKFGVKGEVIEMTRKLDKLHAAWWDGVETRQWREDPLVVLQELISHAFLAYASIAQSGGLPPDLYNKFSIVDDQSD